MLTIFKITTRGHSFFPSNAYDFKGGSLESSYSAICLNSKNGREFSVQCSVFISVQCSDERKGNVDYVI